VEMIIEPSVRFEGTPGEQRTVFFRDPNGYALEFKSFANDNDLFAPF
jgi:extradiol dioxygenase family protein